MRLYTVLWASVVLIAGSSLSSKTNEGKLAEEFQQLSANASEHGSKFQEDIVLTEKQIDGPMEQVVKEYSRNGFKYLKKRWPDNTVVYQIDPFFDPTEVINIEKAMAVIEYNTCVRFRSTIEKEKNILKIEGKIPRCFSNFGFTGGEQHMNLGGECRSVDSIVHELLHVLGLRKRHRKRHDFVTIERDNVEDANKNNLKEYNTDVVAPQDYVATLHYNGKFYYKNHKKTRTPKKKYRNIRRRVTLSRRDIRKINRMYKCKKGKEMKKSLNEYKIQKRPYKGSLLLQGMHSILYAADNFVSALDSLG